MKIGIDIGRVIIAGDTDEHSLFFSKNYLQAPAVTGAFEAIARLAQAFGPENLYLVSKCGERTAARTVEWLQHQGFHETTGISPEHVFFCRKRHEKRGICLEHGITVFIDDRYTVLEHLTDFEALFLFQAEGKELQLYKAARHEIKAVITTVPDWNTILRLLLR